MKTLKKYAPVLFLVFITSACQLISPRPLSQKFYCKINGVGWRPETPPPISFYYPLKAEWNKKGRFNITATNQLEYVGLSVKLPPNEPLQIQKYELQSQISGSTGDFFYDRSSNPSIRLVSKSGIIEITKYENGLVSGTFEFVVYSEIKKKTFKFTKGQFNDLAYSEF